MTPLTALRTGEETGFVVTTRAPMTSVRAHFYYAQRVNWGSGHFLYKEYVDDTSRERVLAITDYLRRYPILQETVPCLPLKAVGRDGGGFGVLMREFTVGDGTAMQSDFSTSRSLALDLALSVGLLHGHGVVHGDLTSRNVLYDLSTKGEPRAVLIDMDMAAVWSGSDWLPGLEPRQAPVQGEFRAPEYSSPDPTASPKTSIWADRWGLAVLIHYLLLKSSPLAILGVNMSTYSPVTSPNGPRYRFPPPQRDGEPERRIRYREQFEGLSPTLQDYFTQTFDQKRDPRPEARITATQWVKALRDG